MKFTAFVLGNAALVLLLWVTGPAAQPQVTTYVVPAITDDRIFPTTSLPPGLISDSIAMRACPGEYEPASFVVKPDQGMASMTIEVTDLSGGSGTIPASDVDVRVVKCWWQAGVEVLLSGPDTLTPELLLKNDSLVMFTMSPKRNYLHLPSGWIEISDTTGIPGISDVPTNAQFPVQDSATLQPVNIASGENKQFWVTVRVPEDAAPGLYSGKLRLRVPSGPLKEMSLKMNVLPFALARPYLTYSMYYGGVLYNYGTIHYAWKNEQQLRAELQDLLNHGITNPTVYGQYDLGRVLGIRNQAGLDSAVLYSLSLWIDNNGNDTVALKVAVTDLKNYVAPYGVTQFYIYAPDEANLNNSTNRNQMNAVHHVGVKVFDAQSAANADQVADILDLAVVAGSPDSVLAAKYHLYGHQISSYGNPQMGNEQPLLFRRNYGLLLWQTNRDGAMDFAYQWNFGNIWDDFDDPQRFYRDFVAAYPTVDGVIDTRQWEGFREGVDDVRYLSTLRQAMQQPVRDTLAASRWLAGLKQADLYARDLDAVRDTMILYILSLTGVAEGGGGQALGFEGQGDRVFPNPFTSYAAVSGHGGERFALYDVSGRKAGTYRGDRIGEGLPSGVYFLKPDSKDGKPLRIVKLR